MAADACGVHGLVWLMERKLVALVTTPEDASMLLEALGDTPAPRIRLHCRFLTSQTRV